MSFLPSLPDKAALMDIAKTYPEGYAKLMHYHDFVMQCPSPLTPGERELIATYVSHLNACAYCIGIHTACAELLGVRKDLLAGLPEAVNGPLVEERFRPILNYARKLTESPAQMRQADADAVFAAGWDERALYDLVNVVVTYNLFNRLVTGLGLEADATYIARTAERLTAGLR